MSEKRFLLDKIEKGNAILSVKITDTVKDVDYFIMTKEFYEDEIDDIVDLLNEQQAEIEQLKDDVYDELDKALKVFEEIYDDYPKNNVHRLYNNLKGLKEMME